MKIAIIDIDGTLADFSHRSHFVDRPVQEQDWASFLAPEQIEKDTPVPGAYESLVALRQRGYSLRFLTGRNEGLRGVTQCWLAQHMYQHVSDLTMRPRNNEENASAYKARVIHQIAVVEQPKSLLCFDDDPYMWPVYDKYGGVVFKAPECWGSMFPKARNLPPEVPWRK